MILCLVLLFSAFMRVQSGSSDGRSLDDDSPGQKSCQVVDKLLSQLSGGEGGQPRCNKGPPVCSRGEERSCQGSQKEAFIRVHNQLRARCGARPLTWSSRAAKKAQELADTCEMKHGNAEGMGQNLSMDPSPNAKKNIMKWFNEYKKYDPDTVSFSASTGHFTQLVWKGTRQVGCAVKNCGQMNLVVCNYVPTGNMKGEFQKNVRLPRS